MRRLLFSCHPAAAPLVAILDTAGARLDEGLDAMNAYAMIAGRVSALSGVVPQVTLVLGHCGGTASAIAGMSDIVVMSKNGSLFVNGPRVVSAVAGKELSLEDIGGTSASVRSGMAQLTADTDEDAIAFAKMAIDSNHQLLCHCNGDAAADQLLRVYEAARDASDNPEKMALRPVMIHAQTARTDQYEKMAAIGMIPSIFSSHVWYWGDAHLRNLGPVRGGRVSACGDAERAGLPFTLHTDTPVLRPNLLEAAWCAVNRITKAGVQLDEDQKVTPYEAMRAITYNGAYQYGEEADKGTLEAGKLADLVVLDRNPLAVDPREIRDICVLATIKEGDTLYERDEK